MAPKRRKGAVARLRSLPGAGCYYRAQRRLDGLDVEAAWRAAAAVVLPSYYAEGLPQALIEATAAGVR